MFSKIKKLISKKIQEPKIPPPDNFEYHYLLNYVYRNIDLLESSNIGLLVQDNPDISLRNLDEQRLSAFYFYFKEQWQKALDFALPLITAPPHDQDMLGLAISVLHICGEYRQAMDLVDRFADEQRIENIEIYAMQRGMVAWCAGRTEEALKYLLQSYEINSNNKDTLVNLTSIYRTLNQKEKSDLYKEKLCQLQPDNPEVKFLIGTLLMQDGDFEEGLALYESRYATEIASRYFRKSTLSHKRWTGESLTNKVLYIFFEQGLGDTLMTCRYLPVLLQQGCQIIAECQPETKDLLKQSYPAIDFFFKPGDLEPEIRFDYWIGSMSLPFMATGEPHFPPPNRDGYLHTDSQFADELTSPLNSNKNQLRIGISWSGNPVHANDARRSIPWQRIKEFISDSSYTFYALQTKVPDDKPDNLIDISDHLITLTDTAEITSQFDLVISVDTSLVHLAGSLGVKTWLLCHAVPEWRWGTQEGHSIWYSSVELFKQSSPGDWLPLLTKIFQKKLPEFMENDDA